MTTAAQSRWVALIGPPAVGKSTVGNAVAGDVGGEIFRLRDFAISCRSKGWLGEELFVARDELGWFTDTTVAALLQTARDSGQLDKSQSMIFENFPGSVGQLRLLYEAAERHRAELTMVELAASEAVLRLRCAGRRVCQSCEPDPAGDAHRPAAAAPGQPGHCETCGGPLSRRRSDDPQLFDARLRRYRHRIGAIRTAAGDLSVPVWQINAETDPVTCHRATRAVLHAAGFAAVSPVR